MTKETFFKIFNDIIEDYYPSWVTSVAQVKLIKVKLGRATCLVEIDDLVSNFKGTAVMSFFLLTSPLHPQEVDFNWRSHNG